MLRKFCERVWRAFGWSPESGKELHIKGHEHFLEVTLGEEAPKPEPEVREVIKYVEREVVRYQNPINHRLAKGVAKSPAGVFPFYRDGKYFVAVCDFNIISGVKPEDFVPEWLERDTSRPIESTVETGLGQRTVLYKIPIRGWDTETIEGEYEGEDHATFGIDGQKLQPAKEYSPAGLPGCRGFFRMRQSGLSDRCDIYLFAEEVGNRKVDAANILPPGLSLDTTRAVKFRTMGVDGGKIVCYEVPCFKTGDRLLQGVKSPKALPSGI